MRFKFFDNNIPNEPSHITRDRFMELVQARLNTTDEDIEYHRAMLEIEDMMEPTPLSVDNRPAVFLNLNRNRDTISEQEWNSIIQRQRSQLIEHMWQQGMVIHTIISEDQNGFTLRTEILF